VQGVGAQRRAAVTTGGAQGDGRAAEIHDQRDRDHGELIPADRGRADAREQMTDRLDGDEHAAGQQDPRLPQRAEVLGAAMAVGVLGVGRAAAQSHREERQGRGDHIAAGLDPGRYQSQAAGQQANSQLQGHQQPGGGDRNQGRPPRCEDLLVIGRLCHRWSLWTSRDDPLSKWIERRLCARAERHGCGVS
jgi:hypothetical protein